MNPRGIGRFSRRLGLINYRRRACIHAGVMSSLVVYTNLFVAVKRSVRPRSHDPRPARKQTNDVIVYNYSAGGSLSFRSRSAELTTLPPTVYSLCTKTLRNNSGGTKQQLACVFRQKLLRLQFQERPFSRFQ